MGFVEALIGDKGRYDYGSLCALSNPFSSKKAAPVTFYGRGKKLSTLRTQPSNLGELLEFCIPTIA